MHLLSVLFAVLAALLHGYIFVMESIRWEHPRTLQTFGMDATTAAITRPLAFNQGFYNLFLAITTVIGVVLDSKALILAGVLPMLAAAVVLIASDRSKARPAVIQGVFPLLATVATLLS